MIQQEGTPRRFGTHASVIQLLALLMTGLSMDGGSTLNACALASILFWSCSVSLLLWLPSRASRMGLLFHRWGLSAFVLIGTPLLRPVVEQWVWLGLVLNPSIAVLLVMSVLYLVTRVFGLPSPFDGTPPPSEM
jgi:hypothetical protein